MNLKDFGKVVFVGLTLVACGSSDPVALNQPFGNNNNGGNGTSTFQQSCISTNGEWVSTPSGDQCHWTHYLLAPRLNNFFYSYYHWSVDTLPRLTPAGNTSPDIVTDLFSAQPIQLAQNDRIQWRAYSGYWGRANSGLSCEDKVTLSGVDKNGVHVSNGTLSNGSPAPQGLLGRVGSETFAMGYSSDYEVQGTGGTFRMGFNAPSASYDRCWYVQPQILVLLHCENSNRESISCPL